MLFLLLRTAFPLHLLWSDIVVLVFPPPFVQEALQTHAVPVPPPVDVLLSLAVGVPTVTPAPALQQAVAQIGASVQSYQAALRDATGLRDAGAALSAATATGTPASMGAMPHGGVDDGAGVRPGTMTGRRRTRTVQYPSRAGSETPWQEGSGPGTAFGSRAATPALGLPSVQQQHPQPAPLPPVQAVKEAFFDLGPYIAECRRLQEGFADVLLFN